jgi:Domain of unknown function (DUF309)
VVRIVVVSRATRKLPEVPMCELRSYSGCGMSLDWTHGDLSEGLRCFHSSAFFEAHEHWESVCWPRKSRKRRYCRP